MSCGVLEDVGQCLYVFLEGGGDAGAPGAFCVAGVCGRSYWGIKRGEMKGVRMRTLLGGESKISPTRSVICVIADEFRNGPALYSDVMKGLVAIESKGSLPIVRLHLVGRCVGGEVGGFRGRDSSTPPPPPPPHPIIRSSHLELEPNTDPNVSTSNHATCYHRSSR